MQKAFKLPAPYITNKSQYTEEFITISEFSKAVAAGHVKVRAKKFKAGKGGRGRLTFTLADDPKNISRPVYISYKAVSTYGVTKFTKYGGDDEKSKDEGEDKEEKKKKKSSGSWSIAFSVEENVKLGHLAEEVDKLVADTVKPHLDKIYEELCNWEDGQDVPATVYRKAARATSSSPSKYLRLTVQPGKTEFGPKDKFDVVVSLDNFTQETPGPYQIVMQLSHIDVSYKEGVVTIGPIMYARIIRPAFEISSKKRKFRDDKDNDI